MQIIRQLPATVRLSTTLLLYTQYALRKHPKKTKHIHKQMREKNKQQTKKYITKGGIIIIIISHL